MPCDGLGNILWLEPILTFMEVHFKRWLEQILTWGGAAQLVRTAQETRRYVAQDDFPFALPKFVNHKTWRTEKNKDKTVYETEVAFHSRYAFF